MKLAFYRLVIVFMLVLLDACSGGGGYSAPPVAPASPAQGAYVGTNSLAQAIEVLVLDDNSFWEMYGISAGTSLAVQGVITGHGTVSGGTYSTTTFDFPAPGTTVIPGNLSATYVSASSFNGTLSEGATTITFTTTVPLATAFDYNTPANLATIAGSWVGSTLDGLAADLTVSSTGALAGSSISACTFTGTAAPRASGKNVFDVTITYGPAPCLNPGVTDTGIGMALPISATQTEFIIGVTNATHTGGTAFWAIR